MFDYLALYFLDESDFDNFYFRTQVSSDPTQTWRSQEIGFGKSYSQAAANSRFKEAREIASVETYRPDRFCDQLLLYSF